MGCGESCLPPPPNSSAGAAAPHCKFGPAAPSPRASACPLVGVTSGGGGGLGTQPSPPPPAGKQHLGFQRDFCVLNPIFQMDGGRRAGQVTCLKVTRGQRRSRISCEGWLGTPFTARRCLQTPVPGDKGCPVGPPTPSPRRQAAALAPPGEHACPGCCPTAAPHLPRWGPHSPR